MDLQRTGRYDLKHQNSQQLEGKTTKTIRTFDIEDKLLFIVDTLRCGGNILCITRKIARKHCN